MKPRQLFHVGFHVWSACVKARACGVQASRAATGYRLEGTVLPLSYKQQNLLAASSHISLQNVCVRACVRVFVYCVRQ